MMTTDVLTSHDLTIPAPRTPEAQGERGNFLLKMIKALRNVSLNPWDIGDIVRAALVLLHVEHRRTT
jgi:hypothetical protein